MNNINVSYGDLQVLWGVSLKVMNGEIVSMIGANAAGKTTILKTISSLIHPKSGTISYHGKRIDMLDPSSIVNLGLVQIPEGRLVFPNLSVLVNLELGAYSKRARSSRKEKMERVFQLFPILEERKHQPAGTLSGGEQQMLAVGRGLMASPELLMFDEPSLGLAPKVVRQVFETIEKINKDGITILLVEQNAAASLNLADRAYVIENGRMVAEGKAKDLQGNEHVRRAYLGL